MEHTFAPGVDEATDPLGLEEWEPWEDADVNFDEEEGLWIMSNGGESGGYHRFMANSSYCYSKYCITFSNVPENTFINIYSVTHGEYVTEMELLEPNEGEVTFCWDISQYQGEFEVHLFIEEGQELYIIKEELHRTVLPSGWDILEANELNCLNVTENGLVIPFDEENPSGVEITEAVDPDCDQRLCFTISAINGQGLLTIRTSSGVIDTEDILEEGEVCVNIPEGSYSNLTFTFEIVDGDSFILADVKLEETCNINVQVADVISAQDYYPFGSTLPGRSYNLGSYRYGFNGMEKDDEIKGNNNSLDFGARIYDPRINRWLSVDPLQAKYPFASPYNFVLNNPILYIDPDGRKVTFGLFAFKARKLYRRIYEAADKTQKAKLDKLDASDVNYRVKVTSLSGQQGQTTYNFDKDRVELNISKSAPNQVGALGDELETASQYENGDIGFVQDKDGNVGTLGYDMEDEVATTRAGIETTKNVNTAEGTSIPLDKNIQAFQKADTDPIPTGKTRDQMIEGYFNSNPAGQAYLKVMDPRGQKMGVNIPGNGGYSEKTLQGAMKSGQFKDYTYREKDSSGNMQTKSGS